MSSLVNAVVIDFVSSGFGFVVSKVQVLCEHRPTGSFLLNKCKNDSVSMLVKQSDSPSL